MENDFGLTPQIETAPLALSRDEQIRTVAMMMAVNYHKDLVIKDVGMLQHLKLEGRPATPLTDDMVIATAVRYETYIRCGENPERMRFIEKIADKLDEHLASEVEFVTDDDGKAPDEPKS